MNLQQLKNIAIEEAKKLIEDELISKLDPEHREQARIDISKEEYHHYSIKVLNKMRKRKLELQGVRRLRPDKYTTRTEKEDEPTIIDEPERATDTGTETISS